MAEIPDFYLCSTEGYGLEIPRACYRIRRAEGRAEDAYLVIRIDPPLPGQKYGLGGRDLEEVIVATRHRGASLFPVSEWPVHVNVARFVGDASAKNVLSKDDLESIAWGELHATEDDARRACLPHVSPREGA